MILLTTHVLTVSGKQCIQLDVVFDIMQFSELNFLFWVTAHVFRFVDDLKRWITDKEWSDTNRELHPEDLDNVGYVIFNLSHLNASFNIYKEIIHV